MNKVWLGFVAILGLGLNGVAQASGAWTGRGGVLAGPVSSEFTFTDNGCCGAPGTSETEDDGDTTYGALGGSTLAVGRFFVDGGIEYQKYAEGEEDFYRSDGLLTLGAYIGDRWSAFGGYRYATFGDGAFTDKGGNRETGPFVGGGISFNPSKKVALGVSLALNILTIEFDDPFLQSFFEDMDLTGVSAKAQMNVVGTPHSVFLRWQRFDGDLDREGDFAFEYTEDYINLGYQATFDFKTWR
jgi:hypothetical protein